MPLTSFGQRCAAFESELPVDLVVRVGVIRCLLGDPASLWRLLATGRRWYNAFAHFLGLQALEYCWLRKTRPLTYDKLAVEYRDIIDRELADGSDGVS